MAPLIDTNESRRRHDGRIAFGEFVDADGRYIRVGYRYSCPRCPFVSRTKKYKPGAMREGDRHALECRPGDSLYDATGAPRAAARP